MTRLAKVVVLSVALSESAFSGTDWDPGRALENARVSFEQVGYSPLAIGDGEGRLFHGERMIDQAIIDCALENADARLGFYRVDSLDAPGVRTYVTRYNNEMMRPLAERKGCLR